MKSMRGANAYARVGVESQVLSASPHQLIALLFEGLDKSIRAARLHMQAGNIAEKGAFISKAIEIVQGGLLAAVDVETGGEVAENLAGIYEFVSRLLAEANREDSLEKLDKVCEILEPISSAWKSVGSGAN